MLTTEDKPYKGPSDLNDASGGPAGPRRYRDIWSAGHSASGVRDVPTVAQVVDRLAQEYGLARAASAARLAAGRS